MLTVWNPREVAVRLVGGARSRCWRVRIRRVLEELGATPDTGLVKIAAEVLRARGPPGCDVINASNHVAYIRCCTETHDELVARFEEVLRLLMHLLTQMR